ncbi:glycoside hydrolase family 53 protein [Aureibacillus halotolerans]|uniref:Arabinogalactan endo-beta-1,4-galactanase n=1 Tax=Aureibacillus halotolerans TaxID=1508390 RepID=A0A4R6U8F7_9BACI|nr:glycosyl hydrolase 53 family protein [Aureibacillus halotolerans]TDQ41243.1 arabinogalactan endo-1,4-beta-galactosidase [Aureibacillus halotolerans]
MNHKFRKIMIGIVLSIVVLLPAILPSSVNAATDEFIIGADVSMLKEVDDIGARFYDEGIQKDALEILKDHGVDYVRLRLWVDPYDAQGNPYGGGTNDLQTTLELAKKAKANGQKVIFDFHYSDFWADPGKQIKPKAWEGLNHSQLVERVYQYTSNVIETMNREGVTPAMVQVGNEIPSGMLWPEGRLTGGEEGFAELAALLQSGVQAVHDAMPAGQEAEIILHLDHGGDNGLYRWWFDNITKFDVDFDIIGLSYYPYWHGTMSELQANLNDISQRYDKDVLIVETAYAFTLADGDGLGNIFYKNEEAVGGYDATPQGQVEFIRDLKNVIHNVPDDRGRGFIWWEPTWQPVGGDTHWATDAGKAYTNDTGAPSNAWDNQTWFDFSGHALKVLDVLDESPGR